MEVFSSIVTFQHPESPQRERYQMFAGGSNREKTHEAPLKTYLQHYYTGRFDRGLSHHELRRMRALWSEVNARAGLEEGSKKRERGGK
jgi:hypothetical protein